MRDMRGQVQLTHAKQFDRSSNVSMAAPLRNHRSRQRQSLSQSLRFSNCLVQWPT